MFGSFSLILQMNREMDTYGFPVDGICGVFFPILCFVFVCVEMGCCHAARGGLRLWVMTLE